jgi:hypothetical protein
MDTPARPASLVKARVATCAVFLAFGAALGAWTARIPAVKASLAPAQSPAWTRDMLLLGLLAFCGLVGEGSAADWSTVYVRDSFGSSAGFAAAAYAAFSIAMLAGRRSARRRVRRGRPRAGERVAFRRRAGRGPAHPRAVGRGGRVRVSRGGACMHCAAGVFGCGKSRSGACRPGDRPRGRHGLRGFLAGPVLISAIAQWSSLRVALVVPVLLTLLVAGMAVTLRAVPRPGAFKLPAA